MKRCLPDKGGFAVTAEGKSSPVSRVTGQLGKPHLEQGQIGSALRGAPSNPCLGREAERVRLHDSDREVRA